MVRGTDDDRLIGALAREENGVAFARERQRVTHGFAAFGDANGVSGIEPGRRKRAGDLVDDGIRIFAAGVFVGYDCVIGMLCDGARDAMAAFDVAFTGGSEEDDE